MNAPDIIAALGGKWHGGYGFARCVAHPDTNPSMRVSDGETRLLVRCYAGCEATTIIRALGELGYL